MDDNIQSSQVIFFLGAGASKAAGVPDTYSFVEKFIDSIKEPDKKATIEKVVSILKKWKRSDIDIELLLETLTKLENKEQEALLQFYEGGSFILRGYFRKKPLINDLKDFIRYKVIVSEDKIQYLQPFLGFIEDFRPFDIISVNYDTCIEQFCNVHKLAYQDGFDVHWNPKTFATEHTDIRLYKLHGSIIWYQSNRGGYIKLPVMAGKSRIQLITGDKAENLMLYPMQKWDYAEPLLELLVYVKRLLESETCKFLIVVGHSFRDDHIRRIIWDAARKNKELHLILIDPNAYQIYSEKLKYYDSEQIIPSSLDGKVICLPYKFEGVFPYLKNYYLKNLREGLSNETVQLQEEIKGGKANLKSLLTYFVNAEHVEKIESLLDRIDSLEIERDWYLSLELYLKMAVNLSANNQKERASKYLKDFNKYLYKMIVEGIIAEVMKSPQGIRLEFNYKRDDIRTRHAMAGEFNKVIEILSEFCETRMKLANRGEDESKKITEKLKKLNHYLEPFKEGEVKFEDYINLRTDRISDVQQFRDDCKDFLEKEYSQLRHENLKSTVVEVEKGILKEILKD